MRYIVTSGGKEFIADNDNGSLTIDGQTVEIHKTSDNDSLDILVNGVNSRAYAIRKDETSFNVYINNHEIPVSLEPEKFRRAREILGVRSNNPQNAVLKIASPMPGLIAKIFIKENDAVASGDRLCILEAMKMENEIRASAQGVISHIFIAERESVEKGKILAEIKLT